MHHHYHHYHFHPNNIPKDQVYINDLKALHTHHYNYPSLRPQEYQLKESQNSQQSHYQRPTYEESNHVISPLDVEGTPEYSVHHHDISLFGAASKKEYQAILPSQTSNIVKLRSQKKEEMSKSNLRNFSPNTFKTIHTKTMSSLGESELFKMSRNTTQTSPDHDSSWKSLENFDKEENIFLKSPIRMNSKSSPNLINLKVYRSKLENQVKYSPNSASNVLGYSKTTNQNNLQRPNQYELVWNNQNRGKFISEEDVIRSDTSVVAEPSIIVEYKQIMPLYQEAKQINTLKNNPHYYIIDIINHNTNKTIINNKVKNNISKNNGNSSSLLVIKRPHNTEAKNTDTDFRNYTYINTPQLRPLLYY